MCQKTFFDQAMAKRHVIKRHTKREINFFIANLTDEHCGHHLTVQWAGKFVATPPMPPPVPVKVCFNHVPPHPQCKLCQSVVNECSLFPPIRFYTKAFVRNEINGLGINQEFTNCNYHIDLNDKEQGVVIYDDNPTSEGNEKRIARLLSICQDGFQRQFLGLSFYISHAQMENIPILEEKLSLIESWDENNELIVESDIHWVEMSRIIGRCRVFSCSKAEFDEKKSQMGYGPGEKSPNIKFCRYIWNGTSIITDRTTKPEQN